MRHQYPGEFYREIVQELVGFQFDADESSDVDADFYTYLNTCYKADKKALADAGLEAGAPRSVSGVRNGLFVFAVGLLTYGRLDVVEDIVQRMPQSGHVRQLEYVVNVLLPLPENLDPVSDTAGFHTWLQENAAKLQWNAEKGLFEWRD